MNRMNNRMHLWVADPVRHGPDWVLSSVLEVTSNRFEVWFSVPESAGDSLSHDASGPVIATLFTAMTAARSRDGSTTLVVHGSVGSGLLGNLHRFQETWARWNSDAYAVVGIEADREQDTAPRRPPRRLVAFSGGIDSCWSMWSEHRRAVEAHSDEGRTGVMVHGFDIPLHAREGFRAAFTNSRQILDSIGVDLITVATNFRELPGHWHDTHGAGLASCLHLLSGGFRGGIIASSHRYDRLRIPWGSGALTDGLLSSDQFPIVSDGATLTRREKALSLRAWPVALDLMRVCWQGSVSDKNCGTCPKCVMTALYFVAEGLPVPSSLPLGPLTDAVATTLGSDLSALEWTTFSELVDSARRRGITDPWVDLAEEALRARPS